MHVMLLPTSCYNDCRRLFWSILTFLFVSFIALRKLSIHFQSGMQRDEFFVFSVNDGGNKESPKCELNKSNQIQFHYNDMLFVEKVFLISHLGVAVDWRRCLCCNDVLHRSIEILNYNFKIATFHTKNQSGNKSLLNSSPSNITKTTFDFSN